MSGSGHFADRLAAAVERKGAPLCVGLDPDPALMPAGVGVVEFCRGIVDAVARDRGRRQAAVGVLRGARRRRLGRASRRLRLRARGGPPRHRRREARRRPLDARARTRPRSRRSPTRSPSTRTSGDDSLEPFLAHDGLGIFASLKTSNPGSADLQDVPLAGRPAVLAARRGPRRAVGRGPRRRSGLSSLGAVVGATHPGVLETVRSAAAARGAPPPRRRRAGRQPETSRRVPAGPASALVSASRSVLYARRGAGWQEAAAAEAERFAGELRAVAAVG